jgi:hypothetical protein
MEDKVPSRKINFSRPEGKGKNTHTAARSGAARSGQQLVI